MARSSVKRLALGCLAWFVLACAEEGSDSDSASAGSTLSARAGAVGGARQPDSLPAHWKDIDIAVFDSIVAAMDFTQGKADTNVPRKCDSASDGACSGSKRVRVDIYPAAGAIDLDPASIARTGHVIAKIVTAGGAKEAMYGFPARPTTLYWIVTPDTSRFVYIHQNQKHTASFFSYGKCPDDQGHTNDGLETAFRPCPLRLDSVAAIDRSSAPAWISCLQGCCVASAKLSVPEGEL